ncbi:hypothetical protein AVEN_13951-1 [Araneus ventricosus]|uniref:Pre-C2HC domain-containing protein n=1 Tax=Araneus ventricosus TaxID=182803 RepID=A0A4Y2KVJ1_ARAVE|nr:hypothetical protein AVEN_13951-1 [Araneus ventricosus]
MVSPSKAARGTHLENELSQVKTAKTFNLLTEEKTQEAVIKSIPDINLKIISNSNRILREICQQYPKTENRLRRGFIGIKVDTEENRQKIIIFRKEKRLEFVLSEVQEDRPVKVVVRDLPIDIEITEIIQSLEEKGYKIGRVSQMQNFKEKKPLPLNLIDVKKHGNYTNIYNEKQICYYKVKVVPCRQRKQQYASIVLDFTIWRRTVTCAPDASSATVNMQPENATSKKKIEDLNCINCAEKGHLAALERMQGPPSHQKILNQATRKKLLTSSSSSRREKEGRKNRGKRNRSED